MDEIGPVKKRPPHPKEQRKLQRKRRKERLRERKREEVTKERKAKRQTIRDSVRKELRKEMMNPVQSTSRGQKCVNLSKTTKVERYLRIGSELLSQPTEIHQMLGNGTFGEVQLMYLKTNIPVAVKRFKSSEHARSDALKEAYVLSLLQDCPTVPFLYGIIEDSNSVIMQFCGLTEGNNLRSVTFGEAVQEKLVQSGEDALVIFKDVGEGLK